MKRIFLSILLALALLPLAAQETTDTLREKKMREVVVAGQRRQVVYRLDRKRIDAQQVLTAGGGTAADILAT